jgi:hypothetical protein
MEVENKISTTELVNTHNYLNTYVINPMVLIIIILIIVAYYAFSSSLGSDNLGISEDYNGGSSIFGIIIMTILVILILINGFQYFFNINILPYIQNIIQNIITYIQELFTPKTHDDVAVDESTYNEYNAPDETNNYVDQTTYQPTTVPEIKFKKQVFNIPGNYYTYNDAKALCTAYGAKLANYNQIENAYNNGAEWCNYGWSANQLALFPTQKKTYANLQTIPGHENDCGRPGVNGGYMANPNIKFGVNCYGYKPKMRSDEDDLMKISKPYPETPQDIDFQKKVDMMKQNLDQILVSPFNYDNWSSV